MKNKFIFLLVSIVCLFYLSSCSNNSFQSSEIAEGFPIPDRSKLISSDKTSEQYKLTSVTEEEGLPDSYRTEIEKSGWKEVDRLGAKYVFEKNGREISLIIITGKIELEILQ
ncbi:hypothetical protein [Paenibacillus prosopidis]|uniref:Lipoprotein n=1 Tax=Paenibacillus prosopidis TaxID=630520 RepID=A0A368VF06_9BACL|nr:hypothetical protein [Paenibacillus prosopidis]RCW39728.1 hypothetical protein DFP97_1553 [Paenibacillus prosopidis]